MYYHQQNIQAVCCIIWKLRREREIRRVRILINIRCMAPWLPFSSAFLQSILYIYVAIRHTPASRYTDIYSLVVCIFIYLCVSQLLLYCQALLLIFLYHMRWRGLCNWLGCRQQDAELNAGQDYKTSASESHNSSRPLVVVISFGWPAHRLCVSGSLFFCSPHLTGCGRGTGL